MEKEKKRKIRDAICSQTCGIKLLINFGTIIKFTGKNHKKQNLKEAGVLWYIRIRY